MYKKLTFFLLIMLTCAFTLSAQEKYGEDHFTHQEKVEKEKILKVYPVPATTQINFQLKQNNNDHTYRIIVYNFLGKTVDKIDGFHDRKTLNLKDYYSGIYIYQLRDKQGHLIESGKFNVVKQ